MSGLLLAILKEFVLYLAESSLDPFNKCTAYEDIRLMDAGEDYSFIRKGNRCISSQIIYFKSSEII